MSKRKIITVDLGTESFYDVLDGKTPDQVIQRMEEYKVAYPGRDIYFDIQSYGYDGGKELYLYERREENDKEYEKRLIAEKKEREKAKKSKAAKEAMELAEYERLRKKFENV